jgi:hypothetical protein
MDVFRDVVKKLPVFFFFVVSNPNFYHFIQERQEIESSAELYTLHLYITILVPFILSPSRWFSRFLAFFQFQLDAFIDAHF